MLSLFLCAIPRFRLYSVFLIVLGCVNLLCVQSVNAIELTQAEQDYIKQNPSIRVHAESDRYPFNFIEHGQASGYSNALIRLVAKKVGLKIEFVVGYQWHEYLTKLKNNEIDVITNIRITPSRENYALYTHYHGLTVIDGLLVAANKTVATKLNNIKAIAIVEGSTYQAKIVAHYPHIQLVKTMNTAASIEQFRLGHVDAVLDNYDTLNDYLQRMPMANVKNKPMYEPDLISASPLFMAVPKHNFLLRNILDKGLLQLSSNEIATLRQQWGLANKAEVWPPHQTHRISSDDRVIFTERQSHYLETHPVLRMCVMPDMLPIGKVVDGEYIGIAADFVGLFKQHIDNRITLVETDSREAAIQQLAQGKCDFIPALNNTPLARKTMSFTFPYLRFPSVIVTHQSNPSYNLKQLLYKPLGALNNQVYKSNFEQIYKGKNLKQYDTLSEGFEAVENKEIYGFIGALPTVARKIQEEYLAFKIVEKFEIEYSYSLAVKKGDQVLLDIFNKLLAAIGKQDQQLILNRWSPVIEQHHQSTIGYMMVMTFLALLCLFLLGFLYLSKQANRRLLVKNSKLEALAIHDDLTELPNRLYFQETLQKEWSRADRNKDMMSLIMIDIDNFKAFNELYGRQQGDACLIELSHYLQKIIKRPTDLLARWEGEEFIVLLPNTTEAGVNAISAEIFYMLNNWSLQFSGSALKDKLSVSIGAASMQVNAIYYSEKELIRRAARALYQAQDAGYNQMVVYQQEI